MAYCRLIVDMSCHNSAERLMGVVTRVVVTCDANMRVLLC